LTVRHQTKHHRIQEWVDKATFLSIANVQTLEEAELQGKCPSTYHGMCEVICRFTKMVDVLFLLTSSRIPSPVCVPCCSSSSVKMVAVYDVHQSAFVVVLGQVHINSSRACFLHPAGPLPARSKPDEAFQYDPSTYIWTARY
jgi:hypothetical protein